MVGRTHAITLCALATSSVLAFAQEPGHKGAHQDANETGVPLALTRRRSATWVAD